MTHPKYCGRGTLADSRGLTSCARDIPLVTETEFTGTRELPARDNIDIVVRDRAHPLT